MTPRPSRFLVAVAAVALLGPAAGAALAQAGPHTPPPRPPDVGPPPPPGGGGGGGGGGRGGGGPIIAPSLSFSFTFGGGQPRPSQQDQDLPEESPDTVIFMVAGPGADLIAISAAGGVAVVETARLESIAMTMVVGRLQAGDTPAAAVARLAAVPGVAWAQPNHLYGLLGSATRAAPRAYVLQGIDAAGPATGVVAMIDTPVAVDHEAFRGATVEQRLFMPGPLAGAHGTAVAALLVGDGAMPGAGRGARLVSLAAFEQPPGLDAQPASQTRYLAKAMDAAAILRPGVLNMSFGGPADRLLETLVGALDTRGVCMVAAGGNGGAKGRVPFPASHPAVLGVTAVDEGLKIYRSATPGPHVDIAAVGVDLTTAAPGGYRRGSGTSFAAAVVSGALLRTAACASAYDPATMRAAVAAAARDLGRPGRDDIFGAGLFRLPVAQAR